MKSLMMKLLLIVISGVMVFFAVNKFLCTPKGTAPEIIDVSSIRILEVNSDFVKLKVTVLAFNKNKSEIKIKAVNVNITASGDTLGGAVRSEGISMTALDTCEIDFTANLITSKMIKLASINENLTELKITGEAKADLGIISLPVDIDLTHSLNFREKLTETIQRDAEDSRVINVESASLKSFSLGKSTVVVKFKIVNPYGIDITLKDYPSRIYVNESLAGEGNISPGNLLLTKKSTSGSLAMYELDNLETLSSLFGSVFKRKLEYHTTGTLTLGVLGYDIQFPFSFTGELIKV